MRLVPASGETLLWCCRCSRYSRYRLGHELVNRYRPESKINKEYGRMKKRIEVLEHGRVPASKESCWKIAGETNHKQQGKHIED